MTPTTTRYHRYQRRLASATATTTAMVPLLLAVLLLSGSLVDAWVPPKYGIENWEPVQEMRQRLGIEYNYTPSLLNPEVCRGLTVEECRTADQALQEHAKAHRALAQKLRKLRDTNPNTGTIKVLVLMVLFSDHQSRPLISKSDIEFLWKTLIPEWFDANSHGAYDVQPIVRDWVVAGGTESDYNFGVQGKTSEFSKAAWNALDACDKEPGWDWRSFDLDGDGKLDSVAIVHSGYGAEDGRVDQYGKDPSDRIWAHAFATVKQDNAWESNDKSVRLNGYTVTSAFDGNEGTVPAKIGLPLHEYMHTFGVIDLYDPTLFGKGGIGNFDIMANPHGIDDASLPGHICAWTKLEAGWVTPTEITHDGVYTLKPLETSSESYQIILEELFGGKQEKLMFENRQQLEYDIKLPGAGLAIYHIDDLLDDNSVPGYPGDGGFPNSGDHYRVALLAADGNYDLEKGNNKGDEGDLWQPGQELGPGKGDTVFPNTDTYADFWFSETGITVKVLDNDGLNVRFEIGGLAPAPAGSTPSPTAGTPSPTGAPGTDTPTQAPTGAPTMPPYILAGITPRPTDQLFATIGKQTGLGPGLGSVTPRPSPQEQAFSTVAKETGKPLRKCIEIEVLGGPEQRCQYQMDDGEDIFHLKESNGTHVKFETSHFVQTTRNGAAIDVPTLDFMATYFTQFGTDSCDKVLEPNWADKSEYVAECSGGFAVIEFYASSGDFHSQKDLAEPPGACNPYTVYTNRKCGWRFKVPCGQSTGNIEYCLESPASTPTISGSPSAAPVPAGQCIDTAVLGGPEQRCQYQIDDGEDIFHYIGSNATHVKFQTSHFVQTTRGNPRVAVDVPSLNFMATYFTKDGEDFCDKVVYANWTDTSVYIAECTASYGFAVIEFYAMSGDLHKKKDLAEIPAACNDYIPGTGRRCGWRFTVPCGPKTGKIDYCVDSPTSPPGLGAVTPRPTPEEQVFSTVGKETGTGPPTPKPTPNPTPNITPYPTPPPQQYSARVTMTRERVAGPEPDVATDTIRKEGPVDFASFFTSAPKSEQVQKASYTNSVDMSDVRRPGPVSTDRNFDSSSSRKSFADSSPFKLFGPSSESESVASPSSGSRKSFSDSSSFTLLDSTSGSESPGSPSSGSRKSLSESSSFAESLRSSTPGSRKLLSESPSLKLLKSESQPETYPSSNSDAPALAGAPIVWFSVANALVLVLNLLDFN